MANSITTYATQRLVKAARGRTRDATFSAVGGSLRSFAARSFSLLQGTNKPGWAVGTDGYTARMLETDPASLLGQLSLNEIVYACMRERMKVLILPNFVVERKQTDGTYKADAEHPLAALLRHPGPNLDTATLWRCLEASYASIGRLYIEPFYSSRGTILEGLNPLNPAYITERFDNGILVGYDWNPPNAPGIRFAPQDLITRRAVDWADVPPLVAALGAVEADELSNAFMRGFFANAGVPSGIVKVKGSWSQDLTDTFRTKWMERFGPTGMAQGGPAIFDQNIESYTRLGVSLNELDNETLRMFIETRICMCFGVPPLIIYAYAGLLKATYSNLQEAWSSFWDATALPLLKEWAEWCTWSLLTIYEDQDDVLLGNVRCRFDPTGIGPYQEDIAGKIAIFQEAYDKGAVTMNEYRAVLGIAPHADGDVFKAPAAPPIPWQIPPAEPVDAETAAQEAAQAPPAAKRLPMHQSVKAAPKSTPRLDADVQRYLRDQYAKARRLWLAGSDQGAEAVMRQIADELDGGLQLFGILGPAERKAYADAWKEAARRIDMSPVIDSQDVSTAVDALADRVVGIADTTKNEIAEVIVKGAQNQQTDAEIADALGKLGFDRAAARAPLITRTELAHASTTASLDAYTASGVVASLTWLTGPDPCPECQALDGKTFDLGSQPALPAHPACVCDYAPIVAQTVEV